MKYFIQLLLLIFFISCSNNEKKCLREFSGEVTKRQGTLTYNFKTDKYMDSSLVFKKSNCDLIERKIFKSNLKTENLDFYEFLKKRHKTTFIDISYQKRKLTIVPEKQKVVELFDFKNDNQLNRYWLYNNNSLDSLKSNLFKVNFPDTVQVNKDYIGNIDFNLYEKNNELDIIKDPNPLLLVGNNFNDEFSNAKKIKVDTFITPKNRFAAKFSKKGSNRLKIKVIDIFFYDDKDKKSIVEISNFYYVNREVYVK